MDGINTSDGGDTWNSLDRKKTAAEAGQEARHRRGGRRGGTCGALQTQRKEVAELAEKTMCPEEEAKEEEDENAFEVNG